MAPKWCNSCLRLPLRPWDLSSPGQGGNTLDMGFAVAMFSIWFQRNHVGLCARGSLGPRPLACPPSAGSSGRAGLVLVQPE